jgi:hypothetical protein
MAQLQLSPRADVAFRDATVVDLLDRVLDRGVILEADLIITVAGVPLLAAKLRAALSSVETMVRHGFMADALGVPGPGGGKWA